MNSDFKFKLERGLYCGFLLFALAVLVTTGFFQITSPDLYWHMKMGGDLIVNHLSPFTDHYSFTYLDHPIRFVAWPFQVIAWTFYTLGGVIGINVMRILVWLGGLSLLVVFFKRHNVNRLIQVVAILFFLAMNIYRSEPRPEIFSYIFSLLTFLILDRCQADLKTKDFLKLFLVLWVATNFHMSAVFPYIITGAYFVQRVLKLVIQKESFKVWQRVIIDGLALLFVGFLNHDLTHPLLAQMGVAEGWGKYIVEYQDLKFSSIPLTSEIYFVLMVPTFLWCLLRKQIAGALILGVLTYKAFYMDKLFPHMVILTLPFLALCLQDLFRQKRSVAVVISIALTLVVGREIINSSFINPFLPLTDKLDPQYFLTKEMDYLKQTQFKGNILNDYSIGGYLLYSMAPEVKVFVDGRTNILYSLDFFKNFLNALDQPEKLKEVQEKYPFSKIIGSFRTNLLFTALVGRHFNIEYLEEKGYVLSRSPDLDFASRVLVHPDCISEVNASLLEEQLNLAKNRLPATSPLITYLSFAKQMIENPHDHEIFEKIDRMPWQDPYVVRLAATFALRAKLDALAFKFYKKLKILNNTDRFALAKLFCDFDDCKNSETLLNGVSPLDLGNEDLARGYVQLLEVQKKQGLKIFTQERLDRIKAKTTPTPQRATSSLPPYCAPLI